MIDPKELPTTEVDWLSDLHAQANRLRELQDCFSMPGWAHLEVLLEFKEKEAMQVILSADEMEDVKAGRRLVQFIHFLKNLPSSTRSLAENTATDIEELTEEDENVAG